MGLMGLGDCVAVSFDWIVRGVGFCVLGLGCYLFGWWVCLIVVLFWVWGCVSDACVRLLAVGVLWVAFVV